LLRFERQVFGWKACKSANQLRADFGMGFWFQVPPTSVPGEYKLRVEGLYNGVLGGSAFVNETRLTFSQRSLTIFVQTDKPVYMQGQTGERTMLYPGQTFL